MAAVRARRATAAGPQCGRPARRARAAAAAGQRPLSGSGRDDRCRLLAAAAGSGRDARGFAPAAGVELAWWTMITVTFKFKFVGTVGRSPESQACVTVPA